jgi:hypothetical protein
MTMRGAPEHAPRRHRPADPLRSPLHGVCRALGPVAGVAAALYAHDLDWTLPGVVLAFLVGSGVVGWVLPDLIVGPRRLARLAFGLLPVAVGIGGFWLAAMAWGATWPALLVGGLIGWLLGGGLQRVLFPRLAVEADLERGASAGDGLGVVAAPDDWIPGWRDLALVLATAAAFVVLAVVDAPALAYLVAAVVAVGLLLVSAVDGWERRQDRAN